MSLSAEEQQRILDLASGVLPPDSGMEKHFMMVLGGKGRPCSPKEKEWFAFWNNHNDSSSHAVPVAHHAPGKEASEPATTVQPTQNKKHAIQPTTTSFLAEFDTPPDFAFEDEVIFEEVREKLDTLLSNQKSHQSFSQQLAHINIALKAAHATPPSDIANQLIRAEDIELAPF